MNELLKIILSLSVSGALLILVLLLFKPLVKDRLSKRWQYYIWLVVVARLLLPFAPETNLVGTLFQHIDNAVIQTDTSPQPEQQSPVLPETDFSNQGNVPGQVSSGGEQSEPDKLTAPSILDMAKQNISAVCLIGWLIVAVGLLIRKVTIYQSFVKYIKAGRTEIADMELWERVGKLVEQTGVKGAVGLYANSLISSPLLIGFFRPCIMLPTTELSESDFENTILHELTHYKRRDMFYKWLVQVTICLHWFNPLVYLMGREVNRACELSCDEAVIKSMDVGKQRAYGDTLLNAMRTGGNYKDSVASVTLNEGKELLKERLDAIMKYKRTSKMMLTVTLAITLLMVTGATAIGAYAKTQMPPVPNGTIAKPDTPSNIKAPTITTTPVSALEDFEADNVKSITLTVDSCGVELVKSDNGKFTFNYLGISDTTKFKVNYTMGADNVLQIAVDGIAARATVGHYYIESGPNYSNVVRIGIPDKEYKNITLTLDGAPVTLPDFNAIIGIEAKDSSVSLSDTDISRGTYHINNLSGSVSIIATTISNEISVTSEGECELTFNQMPQNLELDVSACRGEIVLPAGWTKTYSLGNGKPTIKISNHGYTEISISE